LCDFLHLYRETFSIILQEHKLNTLNSGLHEENFNVA